MSALAAVTLTSVLVVTGCSDSEPPAMPDVVGQPLDTGLSEIESSGFTKEVDVVGGGLFGIVDESNWTICEQEPAAGAPLGDTATLTVDRDCAAEDPSGETSTDSSEPTSEASEPSEAPEEPTSTTAEPAPYAGPPYEVVITDENVGPAQRTQYWVIIENLDVSSTAYRDSVKQVISDIARTEQSADFDLNVVTDRLIAEAESTSTMTDFIEEYGDDYFTNTIPELEREGWVAAYTGGFDFNEMTATDAQDSYEVTWFPYGASETEKWKPEIAAGE